MKEFGYPVAEAGDSKDLCPDMMFAPVRWGTARLSRHKIVPVAPAAAPEPAPSGVLDRVALQERVEGDAGLLAEMIALFLEDYPRLLGAMREAVASGDAQALQRAAHTLKGTVGNFCAAAATAAALRMERMGREGDLAQAEEGYAALAQELDRLKASLAEFCQEVTG